MLRLVVYCTRVSVRALNNLYVQKWNLLGPWDKPQALLCWVKAENKMWLKYPLMQKWATFFRGWNFLYLQHPHHKSEHYKQYSVLDERGNWECPKSHNVYPALLAAFFTQNMIIYWKLILWLVAREYKLCKSSRLNNIPQEKFPEQWFGSGLLFLRQTLPPTKQTFYLSLPSAQSSPETELFKRSPFNGQAIM